MKKLPIESSFSYRKGSWLVFQDNGHWIRLWLSSINGMERFYFDEELISERRKLTKLVTQFEHKTAEGDTYEIELKASFDMKNPGSVCALSKNGVAIRRVERRSGKFMRVYRRVLYSVGVLFLVVSLLINIGQYPAWLWGLPIIALTAGIIYIISSKTPMVEFVDTTDFLED